MSLADSISEAASGGSGAVASKFAAGGIANDFFHDLSALLNEEPEAVVNVNERVRDLEQRLGDRNRLVEILTERLERTADELDRLRRSGGVKKTSSESGDACSTELVQSQRELRDELGQFYAAWEERYEGPALRRIQNQLDDLQALLEEKQSRSASEAPQSLATVLGSQFAIDQSSADRETGTRSHSHSVEESSVLDADGHSSGDVLSTDRSQRTARGLLQIVLLSAVETPEGVCVPLPQPVSPEALRDELQQAVQSRDRYIEWLCHQVRKITTGVEDWFHSVAQDSSDESLKERASEASRLIQDQLRVAEVELSIQRARLSREQAQLKQEMTRLERERDRAQAASADADVGGSEPESRMMKRWKKFLT